MQDLDAFSTDHKRSYNVESHLTIQGSILHMKRSALKLELTLKMEKTHHQKKSNPSQATFPKLTSIIKKMKMMNQYVKT